MNNINWRTSHPEWKAQTNRRLPCAMCTGQMGYTSSYWTKDSSKYWEEETTMCESKGEHDKARRNDATRCWSVATSIQKAQKLAFHSQTVVSKAAGSLTAQLLSSTMWHIFFLFFIFYLKNLELSSCTPYGAVTKSPFWLWLTAQFHAFPSLYIYTV